ncbi:MAG: glycosyltransferase [Planctomycetes bacterium]|nr:glycosyltransferase [Planctomycetota bacterium]
MSTESVSLVVPGRNCASTVRQCLSAVAPLLDGGRLGEIIFVDDGSTDETANIVAEFPVTYVKGSGRGSGAARNLGWREARHPLVWFIDADCVTEPDALDRLLPHLDDPTVGGVSGSYGIMNPESSLACLVHEEITQRHLAMPSRVNFLAAFNVLYRRTALEEVGGFDERFLKGQDAELSFRIHGAGHQLAFERQSRVKHYHPAKWLSYLRTQRQQGFWRVRLHLSHRGHAAGDSYSGWVDHIQPPLAMVTLVSIGLLPFPVFRWIPIAFLLMLAAAQLPMTCRLLGRLRQVRYAGVAVMSFVRAFWRGVGMTHGLLSYLASRKEARHSVVLVAGTGVTAVLALIYTVYAQRVLGPALSADFVTALSLMALCQIALGPINGTVARFTAQFASRQELGRIRGLSREVTKRVAVFALAGVVVGLIALKPLATFLAFDSVVPLLLAYAAIYSLLVLSVARGVLRGLQAFGKLNLNTIVEAAIRLCVGVAILSVFVGATAGLAAYLIALVAILGFSYVQLSRVWVGCEPVAVDRRAIIRFTLPLFLVMMTSAGFQNVDMLTVKHYFVRMDAGVYGAGFTLARSMAVFVTPFTTLMLPLLTTLHERGERILGTLLRLTSYFLLLAALPVAVIALWPEWIIGVLFREEFAGASQVLLMVTVARLLGFLCHILALAGAATNNFRFLVVYVPGLIVQTISLAVWHESLSQIASLLVLVHGATLVAMILVFTAMRSAPSRRKT